MCNIDLIQLMQFIFVILFVVSITCCITLSVRNSSFVRIKHSSAFNFGILISYSNKLTVVHYEPFHKYDIWRYYRLSPSR
ncbi:MAG: hypothetical protein ACOYWZ_21735 [Bacillota bacterium]